jgi:trehalose/maltose hydrolase-like predicted phosphorylase
MTNDSAWTVTEAKFDSACLLHHETVFTLGNGYLGTRGSLEESYPGDRPATLIHGVYDDVPIAYTELANCPDWLPLHVFVKGEQFRLDKGKILRYERRLDLRRGILYRDVRWRSTSGQTIDVHFERLASLADQHVLAIRCQVTPLDQTCDIKVQAGIDGYPDNMGVTHWEWVDQGQTDNTTWLHTCTRHSGIELGMAARLTVGNAVDAQVQAMACHNYPTLTVRFHAKKGQTVALVKLVTVFTSRDADAPAVMAQERLAHLATYSESLAAHEAAWAEVWEASDIVIEGALSHSKPSVTVSSRY